MRSLRRLIAGLLGLGAIAMASGGLFSSRAAPSPEPEAAALGLQLAPPALFWATPPTTPAAVRVTFANRAPRALRVLAWRAGCGCVRLDGLPARLEAGASGSCFVRIADVGAGAGSYRVRVFTDLEPPHDVTELPVAWGAPGSRSASSAPDVPSPP